MTRGNVLAALLYRKAVELKNQNYSKLYWKKNRDNLIKSLSAMQFLTHCIGMDSIQDDQAEIILSTLKNSFFFDTDDLRDSLNEASAHMRHCLDVLCREPARLFGHYFAGHRLGLFIR